MDSLESDLKNYKSLFEEIAQNDNNIYLNKSFQDALQYIDDDTECCCCKVHRRTSNRSFISGGAVTNTKSFNVQTMYNTIWIGEMKNATDYIEYLNETRRVSFSSLNRDNRSNYYNSMVNDSHSPSNEIRGLPTESGKRNHLQVPKLDLPAEHMRRTPEFESISKKIDEIHTLDSSVSSLIYKSIEVHADILVSVQGPCFLYLENSKQYIAAFVRFM
jgi:hypothetical protein